MSGVNKVIIVGNVGADVEAKFLPNGKAVANITLATSESWKDKTSGEQKELTEWHKVVFFDRIAEIVHEYVSKGSKLYIEGSLKTRKWQGQDGQDRYTTEIVASEMQMLDSRGGPGGSGGYDSPQGSTGQGSAPKSPNQQAPNQQAPQQQSGPFDDDIPF